MHPNMSGYFYSRGIIKGWNASTNFDKVYEAVRVTDIYVQIELETCCGTNVNISKFYSSSNLLLLVRLTVEKHILMQIC